MITLECEQCKLPMQAERPTKRFCSPECYRAMRNGWPKTRECRRCGTAFLVMHRADANRWYCNKLCSKAAQQKYVKEWRKDHPEELRAYSRKWREENPAYHSSLNATKRKVALDALGGACVVCGVTNPPWLHIDYIPTCRGLQYRHPRGTRYVLDHLDDFRILCANHHYELTLTGQIEGTDITQ